jgi:carboxypeptidase PM20D1
VRLSIRQKGGHSSMPPRRSAIGRVARAVARLEEQRPPARIGAVQAELLRRIAPHLGFADRLALSNLWLSAPLVERLFANSPSSDATMRTTTAPTMFNAGVKDNVLPQQAEAVVNYRIQPGDSVAAVLQHVRDVIDDREIQVEPLDSFSSEPTAPAPWEDPAFLAIERALREVSPETDLVVAPYVTSGATDARHYAGLSNKLYRFTPFRLTPDQLSSFHGSNERLAVVEYTRLVRFYMALMRNANTDH